MANPDDRYRRWLDEERRARQLDERRRTARQRCDQALSAPAGSGSRENVRRRLEELERALEASLAFYLGHVANDDGFLRGAFGVDRARELSERLAQRKLRLLNELDRVREMRARLSRGRPPTGSSR